MEKHSHFVRCEVDYLWFVYKFIKWSCEHFEVMMMMEILQVINIIKFHFLLKNALKLKF